MYHDRLSTSAAALVLLIFSPWGIAQDATLGPLIAGESSYINGTFVSTDYVYDDRGANSGLLNTGLAGDAMPGGDASYPNGLENAADIVQIQISLNDAGELHLRAILQTLLDPTVPEVGFAFDTDTSTQTGAVSIPGGSWPVAEPLGIELLIVANNNGAQVWHWQDGQWLQGELLPVTIDTGSNVIEVTVPTTIAAPGDASWRAFALSGLAQDSFLQGGSIYDLAFLRGEVVTDRNTMIVDSISGALITGETAMWQDHIQAEVLAGNTDPAKAAALIDFAKVAAGHTEIAQAEAPGWHTFLFRSALALGEGVEAGEAEFQAFSTKVYKGPYQPYLVHRNAAAIAPHPLVVFLHGAGTTHTMNTYWFDGPPGTVFDYPAVTVFPLARGETLGYRGIAEFDVLEVLADAKARLPVDPERVILAGFSMGGIGTYKLASLYPDRFTAAIAHMATGEESHGIMENLLNVPFRADNGMIDYLVNPLFFLPDRERGKALGYDFRFFDVIDGHHALQPHLANCLYLQALNKPRNAVPARVRYRVEPARFISEPEIGLELRYDRAYWVSGIRVRDGAEHGVVDASSLTRADREFTTKTLQQPGSAVLGDDYCGEGDVKLLTNPSGGSAWNEISMIPQPSATAAVSNAVELAFNQLEALTLDLNTIGVSSKEAFTLHADGDGFMDLQLLGSWTGLIDLTRNGVNQPSLLAGPDGSLQLSDDMTGSVSYVFRPRSGGAPVAPGDPPPRGSSGSGGGAFGLYGLLILAAMLAWRQRFRLL